MKKITNKMIVEFGKYLAEEEKAAATREKYIRDITAFSAWLNGGEVSKAAAVEYKRKITGEYAPASVNSILSSLNSFLVLTIGSTAK